MASYIGARPEGLVLTGDIADDAVTSDKISLDDLTVGTSTATNDALLTIKDSGSANPMARISFDSGDSDVSNGVKIGYTAASLAPDRDWLKEHHLLQC